MKLSTTITLAVAALANQVTASVPITGATSGLETPGRVPLRQNIVDLFNRGGPQWTLYLRALSAWYEVDEEDPESFFQIAGIHGRPIIPWDSSDQPLTNMGYCPHIENLFLPWHRPYLALFEQTLVGHAIKIAEEYNDPEYTEAAASLRSPYWDWAEDATVPPFAGLENIEVETPEGTETIHNPLYDYSFPKAATEGKYGTIIQGSRDKTKIIRCSPEEANKRLAEVDFKDMVYQAFTRSSTFDEVASMGSSKVVVAFEQPHNSIHMRAACGSHFAYTPEGAFDPLFFLHHTNIDRLWAMWEVMNPDEQTLTTPYNTQGTFAWAAGDEITGTSEMLPFKGPDGNVFTPASVVDVTQFGYTYSELPSSGTAADRKKGMNSIVNKLYGRNSERKDPTSAAPSSASSTAVASSAVSSSAVSSAVSSSAQATSSGTSNDNARLPIGDADEISVPTSGATALPSGAASIDASIAASVTASASASGASALVPSAILSSASAQETNESGLDLPSFGELPDLTDDEDKDSKDDKEDNGLDLGLGLGGKDKDSNDDKEDNGLGLDLGLGGNNGTGNGLNVTDIFPPIAADLIPDLPNLDIGIDMGIEYVIRVSIHPGKIPTPSEMNVYIGEKFAGSIAVLHAPPQGCIEGEFPIRKVLDVLGLIGGLISDLVHGKIQNPIDAIKDDIHVEFVQPDGTVIPTELTDDQFDVSIQDLDMTPSSRPDQLPTFGKSRKTQVKAKPAPVRPGKCHERRSLGGDLPGVAPIMRR